MLHRERISDHRSQHAKVKLTYTARLDTLPDGVLVTLAPDGPPFLVRGDALYPWSFAGYGAPRARPDAAGQVLTPRSTVRAIAQGYAPGIHASALATTS